MPKSVVNGAKLKCMMGTSPSSLTVTSNQTVQAEGKAVATIMDFAPMANIAAFGMCQSMLNPQVIAATAAAMGVLTPQPCIPVTISPWVPPAIPPVLIGVFPTFDNNARTSCAWCPMGIEITDAGTSKTEVP